MHHTFVFIKQDLKFTHLFAYLKSDPVINLKHGQLWRRLGLAVAGIIICTWMQEYKSMSVYASCHQLNSCPVHMYGWVRNSGSYAIKKTRCRGTQLLDRLSYSMHYLNAIQCPFFFFNFKNENTTNHKIEGIRWSTYLLQVEHSYIFCPISCNGKET